MPLANERCAQFCMELRARRLLARNSLLQVLDPGVKVRTVQGLCGRQVQGVGQGSVGYYFAFVRRCAFGKRCQQVASRLPALDEVIRYGQMHRILGTSLPHVARDAVGAL